MRAPFDAIAEQYDAEFTATAVGRLQRAIVHDFLEKWRAARAAEGRQLRVLELNCGTGEDAIWLARRGYRVLATDVSPEMVAVAREKARRAGLENQVEIRACAIQEIGKIAAEAPRFDLVFSNFGGLNCLSPLDLAQFGTAVLPQILQPGGQFAAVVMGRFCCWETLYFLAKGQWRQAFRRLSRTPMAARLNAETSIETWYYAPRELTCTLQNSNPRTPSPQTQNSKLNTQNPKLPLVEAVGFWLPPSYLDPFFRRFPRALRWLDFLEKRCRGRAWAHGADHFLLVISA